MDVRLLAAVMVIAMAAALRLALMTRARARSLGRLTGEAEAAPPPALRWAVPTWRGRRRRMGGADIAEVARTLARSLRGGRSPAQALFEAATGEGASPTMRAAVVGAPHRGDLACACARWVAVDRRVEVRLVVAALTAGATAGGAVARALDGVADTIEARAAVAREAWAQSATARASAAVLVVAPLLFGAAATSSDSAARAFLFSTRAGLLCVLAAGALNVVGGLWMSRITGVRR